MKKENNRKKIIQGLSFLLILVLLVTTVAWAIPNHDTEPENPMLAEADTLKVDITAQSGASEADTEDQLQDGEQQEEEEQEEPSEEISEEEPEDPPEEPPETPPEEEDIVEETEEVDEELPPEMEEGEAANSDGQGEEGENSDQVPGTDDSGKLPTEGGNEDMDNPGTGEEPGEDEHGLITDLYSHIITFSELDNDTLNFYAYYSDATVDANIKVNYRHADQTNNGTWLPVSGAHDYSVKLKLGKNYFTIYYTDENGNRNWVRFIINYQADKATADNPEVGEHPPIIKTNLDGWTGDIKIYDFTFTVDAKTWEGKRIYSNAIEVRLDGKLVTNPTGSGIYEYVLHFERPNVGDYSNHTVSVLAWDSEGNSRYVVYRIRHYAIDEGLELGTAYVVIDATTVECGVVDEIEVELEVGDTAAKAVVKALDELGYTYRYTGTLKSDFYLASITRGDAFRGAHLSDRLKGLLERDGISLTPEGTRDTLGEFDYSRGSGWMYFINGDLCPGKSMASWTLNGGETISLRFTVAYGKDVGGTDYSDGALSSYCAKWVNGDVIELGHDFQESSRVEPGSTTDGYIEYTCSKCGETMQEVLPATGEEPEPDPDPEPQPDPDPDPSGGGGEDPDPSGGGGETPDPSGGGGETPDPSGGGGETPDPSGGGGESPDPSGGDGGGDASGASEG